MAKQVRWTDDELMEVCVMQNAETIFDINKATGEPCAGKLASTVRGGTHGKGLATGLPSLPMQTDK